MGLFRWKFDHAGPADIHLQPVFLDINPGPDDFPRFGNPLERPAPAGKVHRRLALAAGPCPYWMPIASQPKSSAIRKAATYILHWTLIWSSVRSVSWTGPV